MSTDAGVVARYQPAQRWASDAIGRLRNAQRCPVCNSDAIADRRCARCRSDFSGSIGAELWEASEAAADALETRQAILERVPLTPVAMRSQPVMAPASIAPSPDSAASRTTVQSVLAVAGAALVAIAALVFTFFTPDLTDHAARSAIIGVITVVFLAGAGMLSRRRLRFSAEAVGGLGLVFLALDVWAFTVVAPAGVSPWVFTSLATLAAAAVLVALGLILRVRVWFWASLLALAFVPLMLGAAASSALGALIGLLTAAGASLALIVVATRAGTRFVGGTNFERITLTVAQFAFVAAAVLQSFVLPDSGSANESWLVLSAVLLTVMVLSVASTAHPASGAWSAIAGLTGVAAFTVLPLGLVPWSAVSEWYIALLPAGAIVGLTVIAAVAPMPRSLNRLALTAAALTAALCTAFVPVAPAIYTVLASMAGMLHADDLVATTVAATIVGLCSLAVGLAAFAWLHERRRSGVMSTRWLTDLAEWVAVLAALVLISAPGIAPWGRITIALASAVLTAAALVRAPILRRARLFARLPLVTGAHLGVLLAAITSWQARTLDGGIVVATGIAVVVAIGVLARTVPSRARFLHVGVGYAYALVILAFSLAQSSIGPVAVLCLTTSIGGVVAIAATFTPRVAPRNWYAILTVTAVPFALAVLQVVVLRSGWTAVSTTIIFLLALTLVLTRRAGLGLLVRGVAAGVLVPSLAVVAVCLGAELLATSGSPVVLPVIAAIIAVVLPATRWGTRMLIPRIGERDAATARLAVEASTLVTAAITVLLSLTRDAAGLWTALLVLVIVGTGFVTTALWAGRRYGWWLAGASFTGALWCVWVLMGIGAIEAYTLPPALGAAVVGAVLTSRGGRAATLFTVGLVAAVAPSLALLMRGDAGAAPSWRAFALIAASWILLVVSSRFRRSERLRALHTPTLAIAIAAGMAGAVQGARWGLGLDPVPAVTLALIVMCFGVGLAGALPAALSARSMRRSSAADSPLRRTRWLYAPALLAVAVATWPAIERDWFTIWAMWALMLAYLGVVLVTARRSTSGTTGLPPVWLTFGIAFATAIVAWSPRDLRVEWFSLPLGAFLLVAGAVALHAPAAIEAPRGTLSSWPARWRGSWALLAPGILVLMSASIAATYTDPLTWRAILVIVLALVSILIGASAKLAAPFVIGVVVLPIENVLVFLVQIGRDIESMPWWITLAVVGAVLLIIAVTYERREGEDVGIAARLRDLA